MRRVNPVKNQKLKTERGASFEDVVTGEDPSRYITMYKSKKLKKEFGL